MASRLKLNIHHTGKANHTTTDTKEIVSIITSELKYSENSFQHFTQMIQCLKIKRYGEEKNKMIYISGLSRKQTLLFLETLDDYVTDENPVSFIDALFSQTYLH